MLTHNEIERYRVYDCGREDSEDYSRCDCPLLRKICDQAEFAIILQTENSRLQDELNIRAQSINQNCEANIALNEENKHLKAKLNEIQIFCKEKQYGLRKSDWDYGCEYMAEEILEIIKKNNKN